jgi:hypothetical protein
MGRAMRSVLVLAAALAAALPPGSTDSAGRVVSERPWLNVSLPTEQRLRLLVEAMTPAELITQLVKYSQRIDRLGVPAYPWHMEAAHGVATGGDSTVFPCSLARAASFDVELEEQIAQATAVEARAKWNDYIERHGAPPPFTAEGLSLTLYAPGTGCSSTERTLSRARSRTDSPRACCGCEPHAAQRSTSAATRDGDVGEPHAKCYHPCAIYA